MIKAVSVQIGVAQDNLPPSATRRVRFQRQPCLTGPVDQMRGENGAKGTGMPLENDGLQMEAASTWEQIGEQYFRRTVARQVGHFQRRLWRTP